MRTDISKYLIHSIRRPVDSDIPQENEEEQLYYPLREMGEIRNEFESLINIIEEGGIRGSRSFRNNKATVYGGHPVICFTEMPLLNLVQYIQDRDDRYKFTEYGIALLKKEVFVNKGRPVISGLSSDGKFEFQDSKRRILKSSILPYHEQYRYVNLDMTNGTDWTHEREWRIKCDYEEKDFSVRDDNTLDVYLTWGINVFSDYLFSEAIIIIKTVDEAIAVQQIVQKQLDCGYAKGGQEFCSKIKYLIIDKAINYMKNNSITAIENLPSDTFYNHSYEKISEEEKRKIRSIILECTELGPKFAKEFVDSTNIEKDKDGFHKDIYGFSHVASYQTPNKYMRFLLNEGVAESLGDCMLLYKLQDKIQPTQSMTFYEYIARKQCEFLNENIGDIFTTYSWRD